MHKYRVGIIIYDGVCRLCNKSIRFIIKRDSCSSYWFIPFQSDNGIKLCQKFGIEYMDPDSFVLISDQRLYIKSDAWIHIFIGLGAVWRISGYLLRFTPRIFRDLLYDVIGRNRYRLFGKYDTCKLDDELVNENIPTAMQIKAFIDSFANQ